MSDGAASRPPRLFGADYSVYVQITRLTLEEKGVVHDLVPIDVFAPGGPPADYLKRHPFGRIPAFEHGDVSIIETTAICRYVDEAFEGPHLQPGTPEARARVNQIIAMLDAYAYQPLVWDIYVERVAKPSEGFATDEARIAAALPVARHFLDVLQRHSSFAPWLAGEQLTLADLHAAPMLALFAKAPEGKALLESFEPLKLWLERMAARDSFIRVVPQ